MRLSRRSLSKEGYVQKELRQALEVAKEKPEGTIFLIPALWIAKSPASHMGVPIPVPESASLSRISLDAPFLRSAIPNRHGAWTN
jgi:hypothetical protein